MIGRCKQATASLPQVTRLYTATLRSSAFRDFPKNEPRPETDNGATAAAMTWIVVEVLRSLLVSQLKPYRSFESIYHGL